jgi:Uma2 family endonuclease
MSASRKLPFDMTVEDFLEWCPEDGLRWQLVDGQPFAMAPARYGHGAIQAELAFRLTGHLRERDLPCAVVIEPGVIPHVRAGKNFRVPDLGVTCSSNAAEDTHLREPVLLVEILSPSNARDSWANVWAYTTVPSVREILLLHTKEKRAELLRRLPDGTWPTEPQQVHDGALALESIGFAAPLAELYRTAGMRA